MVAKKKGAGGKLSRSEVITVRFDPKLRFAAELAARKQRRTLSSFVEWAVGQALEQVVVFGKEEAAFTAEEALELIWDVLEPDRTVKLAAGFPQLLTFDEEQLWKIICEHKHFWKYGLTPTRSREITLKIISESLYFDRVREQWENLHKIIDGELSINKLNDLPVDKIETPF